MPALDKKMTGNNTHPIIAWPVLSLAALLVLWRLVDFMLDPLAINWDVSMYLQIGTMLLDGGIPYIDIVEINPPLVWYLHAIPAGISRLLGISLPLTFNLLVVVAAMFSSALVYHLLKQSSDDDNWYAPAIIALVPLISLHWFGKVGVFGQREYLFMLALLPYLILRILRYQKTEINLATTLFIGLLVATTAFTKAQYFGVLLIATELALAWRHKSIRPWVAPEIIVIALFGAAYAAHFFALPEAAWKAFFFRYVPLILGNYDAYSIDPDQLIRLFTTKILPPLIIAVGGTIIGWRHQSSVYRDILMLALLISIVGAITFWLQGKGWPYHRIPTVFGAIVTIAVVISSSDKLESLCNRIASPVSKNKNMAVGIVTVAIAIAIVGMTPKHYDASKVYFAKVFESYGTAGDAILILSGSVVPGYPALVQAQRRSGSRYLISFVVPMLYSNGIADPSSPHGYRLPPEWQKEEALFLSELSEDIVKLKPVLILVEKGETCLACPPGFSMLDYFTGNEKLMFRVNSNYTRVEDSTPYAIFKRNQVYPPN